MLKLIVGLKGSGKTKTIVALANERIESAKGSVVFVEKGTKLIHEISYHAKLLDVDEYKVSGGDQLYSYIAGIYGGNHDVTDIYIDSALKICNNDMNAFSDFLDKCIALSDSHGICITMTSSVKKEDVPEKYHQYIIN